MAAPLGNTNAKGCQTSGRPSHFDKKVEAEALLQWAQTDEALVFRMFAPLRGYSCDTMHRWAEEDIEFRHAYLLAKDLIGARRELHYIKANSPSPFQRYASYYDSHLLKQERDEKEFDAKLGKQSASEDRAAYAKEIAELIKSQKSVKE